LAPFARAHISVPEFLKSLKNPGSGQQGWHRMHTPPPPPMQCGKDVPEVDVCISLYGGLLLLGKALPREI
jgi:hypothetical protein